ncbi:hypothetical protein HYPSUDRAFT_1080330 [Hypholoma sublateritium FD-334 SS-4]|uniref:Protein kinase domain-containing protein n=1 Tax=Hypholoma sublateritium (strain FD-334 SS-4) TaxID=945553 RepID=A0A0D2P499_HYPSF|nr:hypothetical protein HYPSUDRAFT_1080330 [Hypholoma sublateritium FD-334 SS-4]
MDPLDDLTLVEKYWSERQPWLKLKGYELRARYQPDWIPSWITYPTKYLWDNEDWHAIPLMKIMDAVRISDNRPVMLKMVAMPGQPDNHELSIIHYLSLPGVSQDPQNRCVPVYEILYNIPDDPDNVIAVMPLLRPFDSPRFDTVGELSGFLREIFKGIQFLHRHRIAHRDCTGPNCMLDASELYPEGFHPQKRDFNVAFTGSAAQKYTRTQRPPKYYWIDFGLSVRFGETDKFPLFHVLRGNDKSAPEFQDPDYMEQPQDPFPTDIYYLGNLAKRYFTEKDGLSFLEPLVEAMVQVDRAKRPTIDQCVAHLDEVIRAQSSYSLRAQVWHSTDNIFGFIYRFFPYWMRRFIFIVTRTHAIPESSMYIYSLIPLPWLPSESPPSYT